jgi:hypothetical protein
MDYQFEEPIQHYNFVNRFLNILSKSKLPSYCYYYNNNELHYFYNNLTNEDKHTIYEFLIINKYINQEIIKENQFIENTRTLIESMCDQSLYEQ